MLKSLQDMFKSFQNHDVKYVVMGGIPAVLHGVPRLPFNLDILIDASHNNAKNILNALLESGFGMASMTSIEDLLANEITIFRDNVRVDVQTSTPGISFEDAWVRKLTMNFEGQEFYVMSKDDLIASKRASGRDIDKEDIQLLDLD